MSDVLHGKPGHVGYMCPYCPQKADGADATPAQPQTNNKELAQPNPFQFHDMYPDLDLQDFNVEEAYEMGVSAAPEAHRQQVVEARIDEIEHIRDNSSGGGSWRVVIIHRLAELKAQLQSQHPQNNQVEEKEG